MERVLRDLVRAGWRLEQVPEDERIPRNEMRLHLISEGGEQVKVRLFGYKVGTSGRNKPHERRVEITRTYPGGLAALSGYRDVILGIDPDGSRYVGIDPRRLRIGGDTHNASSFFDIEGLSVTAGALLTNPRGVLAKVFPDGIEHHCFFDGSRLAEYLFNSQAIHRGQYRGLGAFSGKMRSSRPASAGEWRVGGADFVLTAKGHAHALPSLKDLESIELRDPASLKTKLSPADLKALQAICEEVGALGEQHVLKQERQRLRKAGKLEAAKRVMRVSLNSVSEGYDVLSFENDGKTKRYIEVKSTVGKRMIVEMSRGEWKAAQRYGAEFLIARVVDAKGSPSVEFFRDPVKLAASGAIEKVAGSWQLDLKPGRS